ncbi:MAG: CotH kinase family protein [Bacteroidaceae bacterium]|nr:CotH kinase family protein [Bacteroidaceae bacterium]
MKYNITTFLFVFLPVFAYSQEPSDCPLVINEVQVANIDQYLDNANCYGGWIELYNPSDADQQLRGMYLTDGVNETRLLTAHGSVPAHGYKVLWFDHYYTTGDYGTYSRMQMNFKLEYEGGTISLLASDRSVIASVDYPPAVPRCSWARIQDGGEEWGVTNEPTPEATNATSQFATDRLEAPVVDTDSRVFSEAFSVRVEIPAGTTLHYTTDGSTPTATNGEVSSNGRFTINETTILRLCLTRKGYLTSPVVTRSYIFRNHNYYLPILIVSSEPKNFFDDNVGIFVKGTNGISGNGQSSACNWNMDWERPVNVNYLVPVTDKNGDVSYSMALNQDMDLEIAGGWSRAYGGGVVDDIYWETRSSFRIKTDKRYEGINVIDYPVFPLKKHNKYRCWQVRNGGNDTYARTKDPAIQSIVLRSGFYVDCQDYQPAHVFLNGDYYGMLNIRESNNKHFAYSNYGIDFDDMDQFDLSNNQYNQKIGDNKAWNQLQKLATNLAQTKSADTYRQICDLLDMDEYINYMALECYMGPTDWITNTNNIKGFRSRTDGKFHFVLFDTDSAFGTSSMLTSVLNTSGGGNVDDLFRNLMKYDPFRRQFMDAYCIVDGSVFEPTRCEQIVREIYNNINPALSFEGSSSSTSLASTIRSAYNGSRINTLRDYYGLKYGLYAAISANIPEARLAVNGQEIPTGKFAGYLFSYGALPIQLSAKAPAGYTFAGWQLEDQTSSSTSLISMGTDWMYYDQGSMDALDWKSATFAETQNGWRVGTAPFGYANAGYYMQENSVTKLDYGGNSNKKRPTYYFRNTFTLNSPLSDEDVLTFNYQIDDGVMLYVNGHEVGGYYIASGSKYDDFTIGGHHEGQEPYQGSFVIPHEYLVTGVNQIAVEIKNNSSTSTDMWFDGSLVLTKRDRKPLTAEESFDLHEKFSNNSNIVLKAMFEPVTDEQKRWASGASPLRINEVSAGNNIYVSDYGKKSDWLELYNTTDQDISLEGLYLSDNRNKPQKYQLRGGVVPAHGTCIIWCDGKDAISQLHAPFKLDNADGAGVSIQAEDGSWADCLNYMEQGRWQTYGRYPDGGNMATILNQPTIDKSNKIGMKDYNAISDADWLGKEKTITLALAEGWNWTSHNMAQSVDKSRFLANALCLRSQNDSLVLRDEAGWQGKLQALEAAKGYKIKMQLASDVILRGVAYDVNTPVTLQQGWNWIGCPLYNATTLTAALANYVPQEGDKVVGLDAFATYEDGKWQGSLTSVQPGQSYLLYAAQEQGFCWQSLSPLKASGRRYVPAVQAEDGAWQADIHAYPDVMTLVADVQADEKVSLDGRYYVGAFCEDECRGVGVLDGDLLFMNIHGEGTDRIVFRLLDAQGEVYGSANAALFQAQTQLGTVQQPYPLFFASQDVIDEIKPVIASSSMIRSVEYYNLSGQRISNSQFSSLNSQLKNGIVIRKVTYEDGSVRVSKSL